MTPDRATRELYHQETQTIARSHEDAPEVHRPDLSTNHGHIVNSQIRLPNLVYSQPSKRQNRMLGQKD